MIAIPKIELHLHLEGAAPPAFIRRLAQEKRINLDGIFDENGNYKFSDFDQFLRTYEAATSVLTTPLDFHRLTTEILTQSAQQGVIYTEVFISPDFCGGRDVEAWKEFSSAIEEAADNAKKNLGIEMRGIVTCVRHFGSEEAKETSFCASETAGDFIVGYGIGGDEKFANLADFAYSFDMAREAGLRLTAHAGEWGGPQSVKDALDFLRVERIGHGVQSIDDKTLVNRLIDEDIVLEVCPGSNIALQVYDNWNSHPIDALRNDGVKVTVSTDDPPFFHTNLSREYELLADTFGWDEPLIREVNITAAQAAFCDVATRTKLIKALEI